MDDPLPGNLGTFGITRLLATDTSATDGIATKIIILVVLVILSAFFSAVETSYTSLNKIKLKTLAQEGKGSARTALKLVENYDNLLYAILIGIVRRNVVVHRYFHEQPESRLHRIHDRNHGRRSYFR